MTDPTLDALTNAPNHIVSFSASTNDGQVIQATRKSEDISREARSAYQLLTDASALGKLLPEQDKLRKVTGTLN
ncbi:hypothetical protein DFQ28_009468 [Apophysomyces sp. BC1034]|nr:hypothetical protein DFQ30_009169 [Apophysomyces sp. BC1015]KAG0173053.1 hypothetical protein DFQ29_008114 [Apophysomyces sp. BC1021]KAG0185372.1 hypothetical protein DFQ28_009468 [Apophysomyces sp. BC1034]